MDPKVLHDILKRLRGLELRSARLRYGVVTDDAPLTVELGNSGVSYANVKQLEGSSLVVDDHVAVLIRGNDLLVLGKVI